MNSLTLNNSSLFEKILGDFILLIRDLISSNLFGIIMIILGVFIIWLAIREVKTWYWKINKVVSLLEDIRENVRNIANVNKDEQEDDIKNKIDSEKTNPSNVSEQRLSEADNEN